MSNIVLNDPELVARIRMPLPGKSVAAKTVPILYTGNYDTAKACMVSINPQEFYNSNGLKPNHPISRATLGKKDNEELEKGKDVKKILDFCDNYFVNYLKENGKPHPFFYQLEDVLKGFNKNKQYSFQDGTCVLLDLVQWDTRPLWSKLQASAKKELLNSDSKYLKKLLERQNNFDFMFLNGRKVIEALKGQYNLDLTEYTIQLKKDCTLFFGTWGNTKTKIIGWSRFFGRWQMGKDDFSLFLPALHEKYNKWLETHAR
ncbi:hypothetical protein [Treponema primitia]|uniref:hypothetical protein n=1 Tax=Treponema primitia TaxID=88058 RepID=UPI0002555801|nr:hypothetical protein [Treponema primitia]